MMLIDMTSELKPLIDGLQGPRGLLRDDMGERVGKVLPGPDGLGAQRHQEGDKHPSRDQDGDGYRTDKAAAEGPTAPGITPQHRPTQTLRSGQPVGRNTGEGGNGA